MTTGCSSLYTERDARHLRVFNYWLAAAMVCFLVATALLSGNHIQRGVLAYGLTAVSAIMMVMAMRSYIGFIRHADELLRKIHLEALAFAFGAGIVAMMTYRLCERLGAPKLDVNDAALVMLLCWIGGQWLGARRYAGEEE